MHSELILFLKGNDNLESGRKPIRGLKVVIVTDTQIIIIIIIIPIEYERK